MGFFYYWWMHIVCRKGQMVFRKNSLRNWSYNETILKECQSTGTKTIIELAEKQNMKQLKKNIELKSNLTLKCLPKIQKKISYWKKVIYYFINILIYFILSLFFIFYDYKFIEFFFFFDEFSSYCSFCCFFYLFNR
jgi:hypothetical protein